MRTEEISHQVLGAITRMGVVALLVLWCFDIVRPFIVPIVWDIIVAVAIFLLYRRLRSLVRERAKLAATLVTGACCSLSLRSCC